MPHAETEGGRLYYEEHGRGDDPPLVLAMGIGGSCRGWLPVQVPAFSKSRRVLIFDYPGVGGSDPREGDFTTADLADVVDSLLGALRIGCADLLGVFMGGMVAQELALRYPERVRRLVLVGTYARPDAKRRMLLTQWRDLARLDSPLEVLIRDRLLWTAQDETIEQTDLIEAMIDFFKRDGAPLTADLFARQCEACLAHGTDDRLAKIPHPTLVVCGRYDLLTPPSLHQRLADGIPDARRVTLSYGAHLVMVESGETFNRAILQFLDDEV
jgi:3-oxoadipate enol-lactonase